MLGQGVPAHGDLRVGEGADVVGGQPGRHRAHESLGRAAGIELGVHPGGVGADGRGLVVVPGDGQRGAAEAGDAPAVVRGPDRFSGGHQLGQQGTPGAAPRQRLVPPVAAGEVEPAGAGGQRQLAHLLAAERVHDPFRDPEPTDACGRRLVVVELPPVLGQRPLLTQGEPGADAELRAELGAQRGGLRRVAGVVPRDQRCDRAAVVGQQNAGLGHARNADSQDPSGRRGGDRVGERGAGGVDEGFAVGLGAQRGGRPRGGGTARSHLSAVGRHDDRLAGGGPDVQPDEPRAASVLRWISRVVGLCIDV